MGPDFIIALLVTMLVAQQAFYLWTIQRLVNKLMSRNFFEYRQAETGTQSMPKINIGNDVPDEDMGVLSDFRLG